jgi:hypothetical protein
VDILNWLYILITDKMRIFIEGLFPFLKRKRKERNFAAMERT